MKKLTLVTLLLFVTGFCLVAFAGCGSTQGMDLETYMKEQVAQNESINAQLNIFSPDAKASVQVPEPFCFCICLVIAVLSVLARHHIPFHTQTAASDFNLMQQFVLEFSLPYSSIS